MATTAHRKLTIPTFTVGMLDSLPHEGQRYELLDGFLLVTPPPRPGHEAVVSRLHHAFTQAVVVTGAAYVATRGAVYRDERTYLEPDVLVYPSRFSLDSEWSDVTEWWVVVEVLSPGSRVYDTTFKRHAYLQMGVESVWLVDLNERRVEIWARGTEQPLVFHEGGTVRWARRDGAALVIIDVAELFRGTTRQNAWDES